MTCPSDACLGWSSVRLNSKTCQSSHNFHPSRRHFEPRLLLCNHARERKPGTKSTMALPKLKCLIARENLHQVGTLIFLHGENHTAKSMRKYLKSLMHREFEFNHVRVIYPQAPGIRYRVPLGGTQTGMWYERISYSPITTERMDSINHTCSLIRQLVNMEKSRGISHDKIIIGGYDMGGIVAIHVGYRYRDCLLFSIICSIA